MQRPESGPREGDCGAWGRCGPQGNRAGHLRQVSGHTWAFRWVRSALAVWAWVRRAGGGGTGRWRREKRDVSGMMARWWWPQTRAQCREAGGFWDSSDAWASGLGCGARDGGGSGTGKPGPALPWTELCGWRWSRGGGCSLRRWASWALRGPAWRHPGSPSLWGPWGGLAWILPGTNMPTLSPLEWVRLGWWAVSDARAEPPPVAFAVCVRLRRSFLFN